MRVPCLVRQGLAMWRHAFGILAAAFLLSGCYSFLPSRSGGQTDFAPPRMVNAADVLLPQGYRIEAVASGLTFPTGVAFDAAGTPTVTESGYAYGEIFTTPRLLRILPGGSTETVAEAPGRGPWNGVAWHDGAFYIAEGSQRDGGRILRIVPGQPPVALVEGLPSLGDHHTNGPAVSPDGWLYFGQGTATNSGIVGTDNHAYGWLERHPAFHDIPCQDVRLAGANYRTPKSPYRGRGRSRHRRLRALRHADAGGTGGAGGRALQRCRSARAARGRGGRAGGLGLPQSFRPGVRARRHALRER